MGQNIIEVIKSLGEVDKLYSVGEVDLDEIEQAAETLEVEFAKDFVEYVQKYGSISVGSIELCGIDEDEDCSTVDRTQCMREDFPDFPMDCYVIESVGIDNAVMVQKADGKIYQFLPGHELMFAADSLSEYLLNGGDFRSERSDYWQERAKDL
ncbi:MAG: SMI1/KNR4 family protein [Paludibacteraceae bacterium]|nr:SMI1/KNR4 family protein [Paludibacteraceae bacterium]MCQ2231552.1 SMI1/KNR4 family protein [Paludibacteraceae bacterium]